MSQDQNVCKKCNTPSHCTGESPRMKEYAMSGGTDADRCYTCDCADCDDSNLIRPYSWQ